MAEGKGRQPNQKMKPYLVFRYLMDNSDKDEVVSEKDIEEYLTDYCGISADKRSIYSDIKAINEAIYAYENDITIQEAQEILEGEDGESEKYIVYSNSKKGYYVQRRFCSDEDIMLMYQCIASATFLNKTKAKDLYVDMARIINGRRGFALANISQSMIVKSKAQTKNDTSANNVMLIKSAMTKEKRAEGKKKVEHLPSQISFKYMRYDISNIKKPKEKDKTYIVSPYHIYYDVNTCHYYLLAYYAERGEDKPTTFRIDRMTKLKEVPLPREKEEIFAAFDWATYVDEMTNGFSGEECRVRLDCENRLLDTIIEKFGNDDSLHYRAIDSEHFWVWPTVQLSPQFFSWLCGFGDEVVLKEPENVVAKFKEHLDRVMKNYK